jgi:OPT family oligopeptide transporter
MFTAQVVATTVACIVQVYSLNFALTHIDGICTLEQEQRFTCPGGRVFFSASVVWGLLGPQRIFNPGQTYSALLWFFPLGAALSAILHFAAKRWPKSPLKYAMAPVILGGASSIPPASPMNYLAWGAVGCVFQWYIRTRHLRWWSRLNYITAMALSTGLALSTITIFLIFTLNHIDAPHWW